MNNHFLSPKFFFLAIVSCLLLACSDSSTSAEEGASSSSVDELSSSSGADPTSSGSLPGSSSVIAGSSSSGIASSSSTGIISSSSSTGSLGTLTWTIPTSPTAGTYVGTSTDVQVALADAGATVTNNNGCVVISGTTTYVTCGGIFVFTGSMANGQIRVNNTDKLDEIELVLNGVYLSNKENSPIYVEAADKVKINVPTGAVTVLNDAATYTFIDATDSVPKACVYAEDDLTLKGKGTLYVNGNYNNGIHTKNDLNVNDDLTLYVKAVNHALKGKGSVEIAGGTFNLKTTSGDGIQSDNEEKTTKGFITINGGTFHIDAGSDAVNAYRSIQVNAGTFDIFAGDGSLDTASSHKGFKSLIGNFAIVTGTLNIASQDDPIHAVNVNIGGGTLNLQSGDDGIQAEGVLTAIGGTVNITKSKKPALAASAFNMNGGTWVGLGSAWDATMVPTASAQYNVMVTLATEITSGTVVSIQTAAGETVVSATAGKKTGYLFASSPLFVAGTEYKVLAGTSSVASFTLEASTYQVQVQGN